MIVLKDPVKLNDVMASLEFFTKDELLTLNSAVIKMAKAKQRVESESKRHTLKVGQIVEMNHPKHKGEKFEITKIKVTKCDIKGKSGWFTVPMSMLICS